LTYLAKFSGKEEAEEGQWRGVWRS